VAGWKNPWGRLILISSGVILADQVSKWIVAQTLNLYDQVVVIPGFFNLTHLLNPGGAFGLFATQPLGVRRFIFLFLSSVVALFVLWFYQKVAVSRAFLSVGLAMIFGGALGNLVDRFRFGQVVDFLDFYLGHAHWPAFNLADSAISIGMGILIYHVVLNKIPEF
jgi:signal peptidase II